MATKKNTEKDDNAQGNSATVGNKPKNKGGRPSLYNEKIAEEICEKTASVSYGLKRLCRENEHWPNPDTVYQWLRKHKWFADLYAQAKRDQINVLVDEIVDISDDISRDEDIDRHGEIVPNHEFINRSRVRIDTRKWLAAKLIPRLYGDRIVQEHTGANGESIKIEQAQPDLSGLSAEELQTFKMLTEKISANTKKE